MQARFDPSTKETLRTMFEDDVDVFRAKMLQRELSYHHDKIKIQTRRYSQIPSPEMPGRGGRRDYRNTRVSAFRWNCNEVIPRPMCSEKCGLFDKRHGFGMERSWKRARGIWPERSRKWAGDKVPSAIWTAYEPGLPERRAVDLGTSYRDLFLVGK